MARGTAFSTDLPSRESINNGDPIASGLQQEGGGVCLLNFNQDDPKSNRNVWSSLEDPGISLPEQSWWLLGD